jgi:hypothetical protein
VTLGLKVLHIDGKPNLKKRRFSPLNKPFRISLESFWMPVSAQGAADMSRCAVHAGDCVAFGPRERGAFMVR